jgi:hypothetical protein
MSVAAPSQKQRMEPEAARRKSQVHGALRHLCALGEHGKTGLKPLWQVEIYVIELIA